MLIADPSALAVPVAAGRVHRHDGVAVRHTTLDAIRGLAVFGILLRNIFLFAIPASAYSVPYLWGDHETANLASWAFVEVFVEGAMRALFSILFGASALLILNGASGGAATVATVDRYYRRLLLLIALGVIHAYLLLWPYDILYAYGVFGLFLFPMRRFSPRALIAIAAALIVATGLVNAIEMQGSDTGKGDAVAISVPLDQAARLIPVAAGSGPDRTESDNPAGGDPRSDNAESDMEELFQLWQVEMLLRLGGYGENFLASAASAVEQQTTEMFGTHLGDIAALMLIGMALFKLDVLTGRRSLRFYLAMALVGYGIGLPLNFAETLAVLGVDTPLWAGDAWTDLTYDIGRVAVALGHLAAIVLWVRSGFFTVLTDLAVASGRMALTNYLGQTVICLALFYGFGFGLFGAFEHHQVLVLGVLIGLAQMIASRIYLIRFRHGPVESLVRRLAAHDRVAA